MNEVFEKLATHFSYLGMGMPYEKDLLAILEENLTPAEATVLLLFPTKVTPLHPVKLNEIAGQADIPREELEEMWRVSPSEAGCSPVKPMMASRAMPSNRSVSASLSYSSGRGTLPAPEV